MWEIISCDKSIDRPTTLHMYYMWIFHIDNYKLYDDDGD